MRSRAAVFLPTPGDEAQRVDVVGGNGTPEVGRSVHRDDREREGGADAVRAEQRLEASALVAAEEPVQRARVFAHMVVDIEEHVGAGLAGVDERSRRDA